METSDPKYKHKPSEKHTLEEVLKSLQDLIRNDLADAAAAGKPAAAARTGEGVPSADPKSRHEAAPRQREDFAPVAPGTGPVNLDAVLRSLRDLVGNELNVGDEPAAAGKPATTHDEYLASPDSIEEYVPEIPSPPDKQTPAGVEAAAPETPIPPPTAPGPAPATDPGTDDNTGEYLPEELERLGEEFLLDDALAPEPAPAAPPEIVVENLPQEFAPLDEELTFEEPAAIPPPAPPAAATTELPGEISSELLAEPEPAPAPFSEPAPAPDTNLAPGTQQELFLEELPPIELRLSPSPTPASAPPEPAPEPEAAVTPAVITPETEPTAETPAAPAAATPPPTADADQAMQALPTIEVEEDGDAGDYFDGAALSAENAPASLEEIVLEGTEAPATPQTPPPPPETPATAPSQAAAPAEPAPVTEEKKITLELASEPPGGSRPKASVDFDVIGLAPVPPQPVPPATEPRPPEPETASRSIAPDATPTPEPLAPPEVPLATETRADTPAPAEPPPAPAAPVKTDAPAGFNLEDIPVLNEVVAPPAGSAPAMPATPPPLPAPDRARDLVVRAVAKLNVEMRKAGGTGLDTKTILRLQQLIRQELEKGGGK